MVRVGMQRHADGAGQVTVCRLDNPGGRRRVRSIDADEPFRIRAPIRHRHKGIALNARVLTGLIDRVDVEFGRRTQNQPRRPQRGDMRLDHRYPPPLTVGGFR